jgi:hypothetical protein
LNLSLNKFKQLLFVGKTMRKTLSKLATPILRVARAKFRLLSNYVTWFQLKLKLKPTIIKTSWAALQEWKYSIGHTEVRPQNGKTIILVAIRNATWIEWAVFAAFKTYSMGYRPVVFYSSADVERTYRNQHLIDRMNFSFWKSAMKSSFVTFVDFDKTLAGPIMDISRYNLIAADVAHTMAAYNLRVEEYEEDVFANDYKKEYQKAYELLLRQCPVVEEMLKPYGNSRIICPNGLIEKSVLFYAVSLFSNLDIIFLEGWARRLGHMIWRHKQPVMFYDIAGWASISGKWDDTKEKDFQAMINFQNLQDVSDNEWFDGFIPVQRTATDSELPASFTRFLQRHGSTFLLGTNVIGDSATLRRGSIFKNQKEWLRKVIPFFGEHPEMKLIIRIHPDEIFPKAKVKLGELISKEVTRYTNIYLFKAGDDVNTNALMAYADAGMAWVSNFGVDMVLHGKPALIAGKANYMHLDIGIYATDVEDYFKKVEALANIHSNLDNAMIERAKIYQRIVFKEMSLDCTSKSYQAKDYRFDDTCGPKERKKFFKVLCGELDDFGN